MFLQFLGSIEIDLHDLLCDPFKGFYHSMSLRLHFISFPYITRNKSNNIPSLKMSIIFVYFYYIGTTNRISLIKRQIISLLYLLFKKEKVSFYFLLTYLLIYKHIEFFFIYLFIMFFVSIKNNFKSRKTHMPYDQKKLFFENLQVF